MSFDYPRAVVYELVQEFIANRKVKEISRVVSDIPDDGVFDGGVVLISGAIIQEIEFIDCTVIFTDNEGLSSAVEGNTSFKNCLVVVLDDSNLDFIGMEDTLVLTDSPILSLENHHNVTICKFNKYKDYNYAIDLYFEPYLLNPSWELLESIQQAFN